MSRRQILLDTSGSEKRPTEGGSCVITVTFYDESGDALAKASITDVTASLYNMEDFAIINSRDGLTVLDANGGSVSSSGVLTLKLLPLDNPVVDSTQEIETHYLDITWTWTDGDGDDFSETGLFQFDVINVPTPVSSPDNPEPGWLS